MGERVLGFAYAMVPAARAEVYSEPERIPSSGCVFVGLISLVDPPRKGVSEAIATCRTAGIRVTMVTGDHPLTAEAIARKVGILTRPSRHDIAHALGVAEASIPLTDERVEAVVITGAELGAMHGDAEWDALLSKPELVLARTSPQQKLTLVENYQRRGEVVAVTGDGVNDAPALKRAQVGVAMGSAGASDVAREAADIVLLDDNFASIVAAIEEGRTLFDNLKVRRRIAPKDDVSAVYSLGLPFVAASTREHLLLVKPASCLVARALRAENHRLHARTPHSRAGARVPQPGVWLCAYDIRSVTFCACATQNGSSF
jgi:sodium/potassium-transporting ATPase subunit alpha